MSQGAWTAMKKHNEPYEIGSMVDFPQKNIKEGVILDSLLYGNDWIYHIKYNEKIVGEALKADHVFIMHGDLAERGTVHVISQTKRKASAY